MAATDLILYKPMVLITPSSSSTMGLVPVAVNRQISFGVVSKIYDTCDRTAVNDNVLFDENDVYQINDSGVIYYLIDETKLLASELPL